jgi:hypothetical protein
MSTQVQPAPARYGFSALLSALVVMGRSAGPALLAVSGTALLQGALMYLNAPSGSSASFLVSFAVSVAGTLALYGALTAAALEAVDGRASFASVMRRVRAHGGRFSLWVALQWLAVVAVSLFHPLLIPVVAVATPYLPLAAMDGRANPLGANLRAIRARPGRWVAVSVALLLAGGFLYLLAAANTLFAKGTPASLLFWAVVGIVAWWTLTAWALVYRQTPEGTGGRDTGDGTGGRDTISGSGTPEGTADHETTEGNPGR